MTIIEILYHHLLKDDYSSFCKVYDKTRNPIYHVHDKLISTAYLSQKIDFKDKRYEKFVDFLLDKKSTPQLVGLLIAQHDNEKAGFSYKQLRSKELHKLSEHDSIVLNTAIQSKNIDFLIDLTKFTNLENILTAVLQSDFNEAKFKLIDVIPENETTSKMMFKIFLHLSENKKKNFNDEPYLYYFNKQQMEVKDLLSHYGNNLKNKSPLFGRFSSISCRLEETKIANYVTGEIREHKQQWYLKMFDELNLVIKNDNEEVINKMYSHIYLNKSLEEKTNKTVTKKI